MTADPDLAASHTVARHTLPLLASVAERIRELAREHADEDAVVDRFECLLDEVDALIHRVADAGAPSGTDGLRQER